MLVACRDELSKESHLLYHHLNHCTNNLYFLCWKIYRFTQTLLLSAQYTLHLQRTPNYLFFLPAPLLYLPSKALFYLLIMAVHCLFALLILAMAGHSYAAWCSCKGLSDPVLQKTLDYACGAGADCNPLHTNGPCFNPNSVRSHCNYAVNSYFQRKGQAAGACDFSGTAVVTASDPSTAGCVYPASASATPTAQMPSTTTTTNTGGSPYNTGILGGVNNGLGPSGAGMNTDISLATTGISLINASLVSFITIIVSALALF